MPCHSAIVKNGICVSPDDSVEDVMKTLKKSKAQAAAVVDDDGLFLGVFSLKILLKNLIPVSVAMANGIQVDVQVTAAPGVSKRLSNIKPLSVLEVVERKPTTISMDSPLWEGVGLLVKHGSPLVVVDGEGKYKGFVTHESLIESLESVRSMDG